jgi:hypothetical protein
MRRLRYLLDTNDIRIRPRYIHSSTNIWADILNRELDIADWHLNPQIFSEIQNLWGPQSIDRFAYMLNTHPLRFNARWRGPQCEDVDCQHL